MRRPRLLRWPVAGALALVAAAFLPSARAEDPDRSPWLGARGYERGPTFTAPGQATVETFVASQEGPAGDEESGWFRFLVIEGGEVSAVYVVDVTRRPDGARLDLLWEDRGTETTGVRVGAALVPEDGQWLDAARAMLHNAVSARQAWSEGALRLSQAAESSDPHERRPLALAAYRALERAYAANPAHLGLLRDLLVADQILVPLEVGSDRGANLAFTWRAHVGASLAAVKSTEDFQDPLTTAAVCALAEGCYAYAAQALKALPEEGDEGVTALRAGLDRLGQSEQEFFSSQVVEGRTGKVTVAVAHCSADPVVGGLPFHRLTFLVATEKKPGEATPVWYSLTCERTEARTRWTLNGWVGGARRLLRLYGAEEPDGTATIEEVLGLIGTAVGKEEGK